MPISRQQLQQFNFAHTHDIKSMVEIPGFVRQGAMPPAVAGIYMWLSPIPGDSEQFDVMYIGKAGFGVDRRLQQHRGGFLNSGTGRANRVLIEQWISGGRELQVHSRESAPLDIFGVDVSLYSAEEDAACRLFEPRWNRAAFPRLAPTGTVVMATKKHTSGLAALAGAVDTDLSFENPPPMNEFTAASALAFRDIPYGEEIANFLSSIPPKEQAKFVHAIELIQQLHPDSVHKIVQGFAGQPPGYNGKPMLVICDVRSANGRAVKWHARIPLFNDVAHPVTIIFPSKKRQPSLDAVLVSSGAKDVWRPLNLDAFLAVPQAYLV